MEVVVLQNFLCELCGWQIGALAAPSCPRCQKEMPAMPGTRRKKLCTHEDTEQCSVRCFAALDQGESGRSKKAAA